MKVFLSDEGKKVEFGLFGDLQIDVKSVGGNVDVAEGSICRKRKRKCYLGMLRWIREVGKDACVERHKWKCYGTEMEWKQILWVRERMLLKKNHDTNSQQSVWKKKPKMHPSMYDDDQCSFSKRLRSSQRLAFVSESSSSALHSDVSTDNLINFCGKKRRMKRVPTGPNFQAELPGEGHYESNPKWLGTKIWPLEKVEQKKSLIAWGPNGEGRQKSCSCRFLDSVECVQSHVREKRVKLKLELGSAYYKWKFDSMGEIVRLSWAKEDECKFQKIVVSSKGYFCDKLFRHFKKKERETLVSYYFNVFLLRRRGAQNRSGCGSSFNSDDEDSEYGLIEDSFGQAAANKLSPVSIFG